MTRSVPCRQLLLPALILSAAACLPESFDALEEAAPVSTERVRFPGRANVPITVALTVPADDEGRGRVLFMDEGQALGWMRIDEAGLSQLRFAAQAELDELGQVSQPSFSGITVVEGTGVAEALVRVVAPANGPDRLVRLRVADFSRPSPPELDMQIDPWVLPTAPPLGGPLAVVELDGPEGADLPEAISATTQGQLVIWDALGTRAPDYVAAREELLVDDPEVFTADPRQGYGLTLCENLPAQPQALAGGVLLAGETGVAAALVDDALLFIGRGDAPQTSLVGAPIYDCDLATLSLPGAASQLLVADVEGDGDVDLLVGAPALAEVWIWRNRGPGQGIALDAGPDLSLGPEPAEDGQFGASLAAVELGGDAPTVLLVGAPATAIDGKQEVGRVHVFAGDDGARLRTLEDLEPRTGSRHGFAVHGLDLSGREEPVVSGSAEIRVHWQIMAGDPRP